MKHFFAGLSLSALLTLLFVGGVTGLLVLLPRLGNGGRRISDVCCKAPLLDAVVACLTWVPWVACAIAFHFGGFLGSIIGEAIVLTLFCYIHEAMHPAAKAGPRIVKFINRTVGRWQNHLALWLTLISLPGFWVIRFLEFFVYWPLPVLLGFPKYKQAEWINVSRHKFDGLVGHDLVWCLYCDWMTGVYSLGAEVLRNVESFWCPIRFYDGKKCDNCKLDFPDIAHGWVPATANMTDVEAVMTEKYAGNNKSWFGHPTRLTVNGQEPSQHV